MFLYYIWFSRIGRILGYVVLGLVVLGLVVLGMVVLGSVVLGSVGVPRYQPNEVPKSREKGTSSVKNYIL